MPLVERHCTLELQMSSTSDSLYNLVGKLLFE